MKSINSLRLGLKENIFQFSLLVIVNAFVGAMIGLERSILPAIAEKEFHLAAKSAIFSFIIIFGFTKAFTNYFAGRFSEKYGRKVILIIGWLFSIPVPFLLMFASSWNLILIANIFLGISQGLTWSTTVIMKIDLVGSSRRGLAMGINEFAGYFAVAVSAYLSSYIAGIYGLRPQPFYPGIAYVFIGLFISIFFIKETKGYTLLEAPKNNQKINISQKEIFINTSFKNRELSSVVQAGFVNNLNDGMAWGLFPLFFISFGLGIKEIGILAAIYPMTWGIFQLITGALSDMIGRKWLIVWGMFIQTVGIVITSISTTFSGFILGGFLLGIGTAMVYPTLLAAIGDVAEPSLRASTVGIYRLWRDSGYAIGAIISGITADVFGLKSAICLIAFITLISGIIVAIRMRETLVKPKIECIPIDELKIIIEKPSDVLLLDVRSPDEFEQGHIEGALNIPVELLKKRKTEIKKNVTIITISNKGGMKAEQAAVLLIKSGWNLVRPLCGGFNEWQKSHLI